jgi:hypothetical protein
MFLAVFTFWPVFVGVPRVSAQAKEQSSTPANVAALNDPGKASPGGSADVGTTPSATPASVAPDAAASAITKELETLKARIEQLELQLKANAATTQPSPVVAGAATNPSAPAPTLAAGLSAPAQESTSPASTAATPPPTVDTQTPFAYADWTWLNGNPRNKDAVWDSKFFTPEVRFDTDFVSSFNHPKVGLTWTTTIRVRMGSRRFARFRKGRRGPRYERIACIENNASRPAEPTPRSRR